jgi:hypothetical protein
MRFTEYETQLLLTILNGLNKTDTIDLLIEKLKENEYIRGRMLNLLYLEASKVTPELDTEQTINFTTLLKRIKFKATPR